MDTAFRVLAVGVVLACYDAAPVTEPWSWQHGLCGVVMIAAACVVARDR